METYGVDHPMKVASIALKNAKSSTKSIIKYHWKTGDELVCVGSYEAKTVDRLNKSKTDFLWQPEVFALSTGKTYRPDLFLVNENKWVEIKGWMRKDAQEKWDEFQIIQPNSELWDKNKLKSMGIL